MDALAGVAMELGKMLFQMGRKSIVCKSIAEQLGKNIEQLVRSIEKIKLSGIELPEDRQFQLDHIHEVMKKGKELCHKIMKSSKWNAYKNLQYARKLDKIDKAITRFIQGEVPLHTWADICKLSFSTNERFDQVDGSVRRVEQQLTEMRIGSGGWVQEAIQFREQEQSMWEGSFGHSGSMNVGVGLEVGKTKVREMLMAREVVGIHGIGGSGKTTLAGEIFRDDQVKNYFNDKMLFLTVSQSPNINDLKKRMLDFLKDNDSQSTYDQIPLLCPQYGGTTLVSVQSLIVLDDVWKLKDLEQLINIKIPGCKILVVSRSRFPTIVRDSYEVECLRDHDAMAVFCLSAFQQTSIPPSANENLVKQVVSECKGLPLALKVIGASLRDQPEKFWDSARNRLQRGLPICESHENNLLERMKISFDHLNKKVQECFLDLGSFPEDRRIPLDILINMWVEAHDLPEEDAFSILFELATCSLSVSMSIYSLGDCRADLNLMPSTSWGGSSSGGRRAGTVNHGLTDIVFSWSVEDIFNEDLYQSQVEKIPERFSSEEHYLSSFVYPLLEETRTELSSRMESISTLPYARVKGLEELKHYLKNGGDVSSRKKNFYRVKVDSRRIDSSEENKEPYKVLPNDLLILAEVKPGTVSDLYRTAGQWRFASVTKVDDKSEAVSFEVATGSMRDVILKGKQLFAISTVNMTTNVRIWTALQMRSNLNVVKEILCTDSLGEEECIVCPSQSDFCNENLGRCLLNDLNKYQAETITTCLRKIRCQHRPRVELVWGPPGTGKTKTTATMLLSLLKMKCRTVVCAPTNVAVVEVASRVVQLIRAPSSLLDVLIFGNEERLKVDDSDVREVYLDYRIKSITKFCALLKRCKQLITSAVSFVDDAAYQFHKSPTDETGERKSFLKFLTERIKSTIVPLERCLVNLYTHESADYILKHNVHTITELLSKLELFSALLSGKNLRLFSGQSEEAILSQLKRCEFFPALKSVLGSLNELKLPPHTSWEDTKKFCFQSATLIFCTASNTFKLYPVDMGPPELLVIDEAAQLKECESAIPLQLPGLKHAILIGDERQLPSIVNSDVAGQACFGRSLFERLSTLGKSKHSLKVQYRMHPSISCFPNQTFYGGMLHDGPNVKDQSYTRRYLPKPMFGSYSFINVSDGREDREDGGASLRNLVEADVAAQILSNLHKAWSLSSKDKLSIGIISPYAAQIRAISERLRGKYECSDGFTVTVNTVDGFQGREQDIIILSTVRSNKCGSIGFLANKNRANVALTRARYALWILGNQRTLQGSPTVWEALVSDAIDRRRFFNAEDEKGLAKLILEAKAKYNQLDDLLARGSILTRNSLWKVIFSKNFCQSFRKLTSSRTKSSVMNLLMKLSSGQRPRRHVDLICRNSSQIVKQYRAENLYVFCTVDIEKERKYIQILKVWDVLPLEDVTKTVERLDGIYTTFSDEYIRRCKQKSFKGNLQIPVSWRTPFDFHRQEGSSSANGEGNSDYQRYNENSEVKESLLLMKFYSLSSGTVNHLLTDRDGKEVKLPFEVTKEQREIIQFPLTTFILGRSGTGKTTVLTMKLVQREQLHRMATVDYRIGRGSNCVREVSEEMPEDANHDFLRQMFVTVSPKLCSSVGQQLSQLKSFTCGGNISVASSTDREEQLEDIPDSFMDIPSNSYPLIITFSKFLMMLDGSIGVSYFERFHESRDICREKHGSARSLALQAFIQEKEVNCDKFCEVYWPHFNAKLTKTLYPSRVFTEIISHIKGNLQVGNSSSSNGRLSRKDYVSLSGGRASSLTLQEWNKVYNIFLEYEKKKLERREFDLSDFVNDLHSRLLCQKMNGDEMDFVYVDEAQDLTMRQIALFRYISRNVEEGFIFSGDTAQTISRGIDFKFEDVRQLFYNEFMQDSGHRGNMSKIFQLSQNFRTHDCILKLAQSVIDLLCHFFPFNVDALSRESSSVRGEVPVFLELQDDLNSMVSIFGNAGNVEGDGSEPQVILVRDDFTRDEVLKYAGKQALVLTIMECKGLEFQDVVLYGFFGSSPMKNQWRVLYDYMKAQNLLPSSFTGQYPRFNSASHNILCSELKQLYVAITRTRQRLWICESSEQVSKPMVDYWRSLSLIRVE